MKTNLILIALLLTVATVTSCKEDSLVPPKWELPQPIDPLLVGSWELIKDGMLDITDHSRKITFYDDNTYIIKFINSVKYDCRWSVNNDTLVLPDAYNYHTNRFADYTYNLSEDGKLLYVKLVNYPYVGSGEHSLELMVPLGIADGTFKRLEAE